MRKTGAEILWECLEREGVEVVFGLPGGAIMPVYDAMLEYPVHHVLVRHEQGASHMADGYARYSGKPGIVFVTRTAGSANTIVGTITAYSSDSPIIIIAGDVPTENFGKGDYQEFDLVNMFKPITKYSIRIETASNIPYFMQKALRISLSGRQGPVFLSIPGNFMTKNIELSTNSRKRICFCLA